MTNEELKRVDLVNIKIIESVFDEVKELCKKNDLCRNCPLHDASRTDIDCLLNKAPRFFDTKRIAEAVCDHDVENGSESEEKSKK